MLSSLLRLEPVRYTNGELYVRADMPTLRAVKASVTELSERVSKFLGAPGTKAAPAAAGSGTWVLRRPLDGLDFHHAQNSSAVDKELPACRVQTGGRGDEGQ